MAFLNATTARRRLNTVLNELIDHCFSHLTALFSLVAIAHAGITRLLVEGGSSLSAALLRADLIDRLAWFTAPLLIGGDGLPAVAGFGVDALPDAKRFVLDGRQIVGADRLAFYRRTV